MLLDFGSTYTRRLPVYFVISTGDTMSGSPIQAVQDGLLALHKDLLSQPQAVEQVWLSLITFATAGTQLVPLTELPGFAMPSLAASGGCNLRQGLQMLLHVLSQEIVPTTSEQKGDFRPLVFLILDGNPTDRWEKELANLAKAYEEKKLGTLVAIGLGEQANLAVLLQLTKSVLWMPEFKPTTLSSFFRWTSASVSTVSRSISFVPSDTVVPLPKPPDGCDVIL